MRTPLFSCSLLKHFCWARSAPEVTGSLPTSFCGAAGPETETDSLVEERCRSRGLRRHKTLWALEPVSSAAQQNKKFSNGVTSLTPFRKTFCSFPDSFVAELDAAASAGRRLPPGKKRSCSNKAVPDLRCGIFGALQLSTRALSECTNEKTCPCVFSVSACGGTSKADRSGRDARPSTPSSRFLSPVRR